MFSSRLIFFLGLLGAWVSLPAPSTSTTLSPDPLVGAWTLVSVVNVLQDGSRVPMYGAHPFGLLLLDGSGHYSLQMVQMGRPKFAANDKSLGTAAEYAAAIQGSNAHFGTYAVDASACTIGFLIEGATFPNWEGALQCRSFTLIGNELIYRVPVPSSGTARYGEVTWRRLVGASP